MFEFVLLVGTLHGSSIYCIQDDNTRDSERNMGLIDDVNRFKNIISGSNSVVCL